MDVSNSSVYEFDVNASASNVHHSGSSGDVANVSNGSLQTVDAKPVSTADDVPASREHEQPCDEEGMTRVKTRDEKFQERAKKIAEKHA